MGKGNQPQQVVQNTGLPDYVDPYFKRLLKGAEEATMPFDPETGESTYTPYTGERLTKSADYGDIGLSRGMIRDVAGTGITGMDEALAAQLSGSLERSVRVSAARLALIERGLGLEQGNAIGLSVELQQCAAGATRIAQVLFNGPDLAADLCR